MKSKNLSFLTVSLISLAIFHENQALYADSKDDDQPSKIEERNEKQKENKADRQERRESIKQVIKQDNQTPQDSDNQQIQRQVNKQDRQERRESVKQVIKQNNQNPQDSDNQQIQRRFNKQDRQDLQGPDNQQIERRFNRQDRRDQKPVKQEFEQIKQRTVSKRLSKEAQENIKTNLPALIQNEKRSANRVRDGIRRHHPEHSRWFNREFFERHHYTPRYQHQWDRWSRRAKWGNISVWLGWDRITPVYYNEQGYPIILYTNYDNTRYEDLGSSIWLPLGVFVLSKDVESAETSNLYIELAINKERELSGTYYNVDKDLVYQLEGFVDQDTQIAAWRFSDISNSPLMTTGIYNLTQDVAPVTIYMEDGSVQNNILINLNQDK